MVSATPAPGVGNFLLCRLLSAAALKNRHSWYFPRSTTFIAIVQSVLRPGDRSSHQESSVVSASLSADGVQGNLGGVEVGVKF